MEWLTKELKDEIQKVFAPRYKRKMSDGEIVLIAENLVELVEECAKFRWREYEKQNASRI